MYNGVPLVERIKRLVEAQVTILESWVAVPGPDQINAGNGLSADQLDQLKILAMIARQLDLDSIEPTPTQSGPVHDSGVSVDDLIAQIPRK